MLEGWKGKANSSIVSEVKSYGNKKLLISYFVERYVYRQAVNLL